MMGEILSEDYLWLLLLMQGTACIALGLAGSEMLKRHAARAHQVLLIALLAAALLPASYLGVKHFELGVLAAPVPIASEPEELLDPQPVEAVVWTEVFTTQTEPTRAVAETAAVPLPISSVEQARTARVPWRVILSVCWAAATLVLTARLALRFVLGVFLLRNARPVEAPHMRRALDEACKRINITGSVNIRANSKICSPVIWCWSRTPTLLVQTDAWEDTRRRDWVGVFCHELAHLRRRDHATGLLAELLICLAPWHPLLWWARKQLLRFSEEACDDWVLAGGQIGVDYAESLLELAPQPELAFVPTVVGKEKTMKARIFRIVQDQCGNPHIGRRWTAIVTVLILGLAVGVAFAQRRPAAQPEIERQEQHELMIAGRRNVLNRMLEQLVDQTRDIEAALRERGDDRGEDGTVMRAELDALHEHIGIVERQLRDLERDGRRRPEANPLRPRLEQIREFEVQAEGLTRRREELTERAEQMEVEDRELGDRRPEARERVELELRHVHEEIEAVAREEAQLEQVRARIRPRRTDADDFERRTAEARRRAEEAARARAEGERMRDLTEHLRELQTHALETELHLDHIDDKDNAEAHEMHANLDATHEEMAHVEQELSRLRVAAARAGAERATRPATTRAVSRGRRATAVAPRREGTPRQVREGLMAQIRLTEDELKAAREEEDGPGAERLQRQLEQLHERRESLEREAGARAEAERGTRSTTARSVARGRRASVQAPLQGGAFHNLLANIRQNEEELKAAREREDHPEAERLRLQLDTLHALREFHERNPGYQDEFHTRVFQLRHASPQEASSILGRALGGSASVKAFADAHSLLVVGTPDAHSRAETLLAELDVPEQERGKQLQVEVEELRGKVDGMHEEMAQMREMLQQLLERSEVEEEEKIQEFREY